MTKISKKAYFEQVGYKPHSEEQWNAHNSTARFRIPCCGRRWGKSTFAAREMGAALFQPDSYFWIVGPDYSAAEKEFRIILSDLKNKLGLGKKIKSTYNPQQGNMRIEMPWGTVLECKSAKLKDSLVGEGLAGVIMSEAAMHSRDTWEMYIRPALSDRRGWAIFPSTPRGYNWYEGLWRLGQELDEPEYESWRFPSWTNPIVYPEGRTDPEIISIELNASKGFFMQEIAAEFTAFEGQIYEDFDRTIHVTDIEYNPYWENYLAFDFGFTNPFVALDIMVDPSDNVYIWREYYERNKTNGEHGIILRNRANPPDYHVDDRYGDPRDPDAMATLTPLIGYVHGDDVPWNDGIEAVSRHMKINPETGKPRLFIDRSCVNTIREVEQLRRPEIKEGRVSLEGQHKHNDHTADALRYFFNERFVRWGGGHLSDLYSPGAGVTEAEGFFQANRHITSLETMRF